MSQNLGNAAEAVLRGKFIVLNTFVMEKLRLKIISQVSISLIQQNNNVFKIEEKNNEDKCRN